MQQDLSSLIGHHVYDAEGDKIGTAGTIYQSDATGDPEWITVKTGLFGTKESFVPLHGAEADERGLHVVVRKEIVKDAPRIDEDGRLSDSEIAELYRHYGFTPGSAVLNSGQAGRGAVPPPRTDMERDTARRGPAGRNGETTARPSSAAAGEPAADPEFSEAQRQSVLRSEERLHAGTETVETGRVRLRKYVVTSHEQITVPVRREEVHVTREPVKPGEARTGAEIGDEEREIILHEERPVVAKETVPVERVSLDAETVQENQEVSDTVRREEVEIDDGTERPRQK
jgi:uncharacterized protein (TIGR02271 family)